MAPNIYWPVEVIFLLAQSHFLGIFTGLGPVVHCWCWALYFHQRHKNTEFFENLLNPVMLVFIGKLLLSPIRWVPICQGFHHFWTLYLSASTSVAKSLVHILGYSQIQPVCIWISPKLLAGRQRNVLLRHFTKYIGASSWLNDGRPARNAVISIPLAYFLD